MVRLLTLLFSFLNTKYPAAFLEPDFEVSHHISNDCHDTIWNETLLTLKLNVSPSEAAELSWCFAELIVTEFDSVMPELNISILGIKLTP